MVKIVTLMRRPTPYSMEEFQAHWLEYHSHLGHRMRPMRRYIQYHTLTDDPCRDMMIHIRQSQEEPVDGAAVGWFDNIESTHGNMRDNPDVLNGLKDMAFFTDLSRTVPNLTEEKVIIEPEAPVPYVLIGCLRCHPNMDRAGFQELWLRQGADMGRRCYDQGQVMGYIQNHTFLDEKGNVEEVGATLETFDGIAMFYFQSIMMFKAFMISSLAEKLFEEEADFVDHSRSIYTMTKRHVITELVR